MSLSVRRLVLAAGAVAAAFVAAAYPSWQEAGLAQQAQERSALALEQKLAREFQAHSLPRHLGELFPHGR